MPLADSNFLIPNSTLIVELVAFLISAAPDLRVLTTSRAPLAIAAERVYQLGTLATADATELFEQRVGAEREVRRVVLVGRVEVDVVGDEERARAVRPRALQYRAQRRRQAAALWVPALLFHSCGNVVF